MHLVTSPTVKDLFHFPLSQTETECQVTSRLGEKSQDVVPTQQGLWNCLPRGQLDPRRTLRPAPTSDTGN